MLLVPIILLSIGFCKSFFDFFKEAGQIRRFGQNQGVVLYHSAILANVTKAILTLYIIVCEAFRTKRQIPPQSTLKRIVDY